MSPRVKNKRFFIVIALMLLYAANSLGYFASWNQSCYNDIAIHNYNCISNSMKCFDEMKQRNKVFYCTTKDLLAKNNNFCATGICDGRADGECRDGKFSDRIQDVSEELRHCMFKSNFLSFTQ